MGKANAVGYYKNLSHEKEMSLMLWLDYFEESIINALLQKRRWKKIKKTWDLQTFFVAVSCGYEATNGLMNLRFFCPNEPQIWKVMSEFRDYVDDKELREVRHESIHRDDQYNLGQKTKRQLSAGKLIILGGYNASADTYQFGSRIVKVSEVFKIVEDTRRNIRKILDKKITFYRNPMMYTKGMIPWTYLHSYLK